MTPVWFRLLMEWERSGRFGLTIPFVYGALNRPDGPLRGAPSFMKLQSLVTSLVDDVPDGSLIRLYNCATVNDLILARVTAVPNNCLSIPSSN